MVEAGYLFASAVARLQQVLKHSQPPQAVCGSSAITLLRIGFIKFSPQAGSISTIILPPRIYLNRAAR